MSDDDHPNPLTDEVVAGMAEEGGVEELAAEVVIPSKGRKPRVTTAERKRTRQFGMYVAVGVKLDIPKVHACSKRGEIERFTYFHTEESHFTQQVFIFWVKEPWTKGRCIAFMERMGGSMPIFKIGKDKHASIEKQFRHNAEQKQMKLNMAQVCLWREFQCAWFTPRLTCTSHGRSRWQVEGTRTPFSLLVLARHPLHPFLWLHESLPMGRESWSFSSQDRLSWISSSPFLLPRFTR